MTKVTVPAGGIVTLDKDADGQDPITYTNPGDKDLVIYISPEGEYILEEGSVELDPDEDIRTGSTPSRHIINPGPGSIIVTAEGEGEDKTTGIPVGPGVGIVIDDVTYTYVGGNDEPAPVISIGPDGQLIVPTQPPVGLKKPSTPASLWIRALSLCFSPVSPSLWAAIFTLRRQSPHPATRLP